jgi:hypothetical protein
MAGLLAAYPMIIVVRLAARVPLEEAIGQGGAWPGTAAPTRGRSAYYEASLRSALDKLGFKAADGSRASTNVSFLR